MLTIFHYVLGGLAGVFSLFPAIHFFLGLFFIVAPERVEPQGQPAATFIGWIFVLLSSIIILIGCVFAGFLVATGRFLAQRNHYMFCYVMAIVECFFMPFGTALGVFTLIVLMRDSVKQLFGSRPIDTPAA